MDDDVCEVCFGTPDLCECPPPILTEVPAEVYDSRVRPRLIVPGAYVRVESRPSHMVPGHELPAFSGFVKDLEISKGRVVVNIQEIRTTSHKVALPEQIKVTKDNTGRVAGEHPAEVKARKAKQKRSK